MAPLLPLPLRTALTVEPYDVDDDELGDDLPRREAKRRRIETIANQYLTGTVPFIQSAALRGPFNADWKNPWSKTKPASRNPSSRPAARYAAARPRRQASRALSRQPESDSQPLLRLIAREHTVPSDSIARDRERQAKADAERAEEGKRKAKAERKEQRRQELRKREAKAAELRKDGLGRSPAQPVDLTAERDDAGLPARPTFSAFPAGLTHQEDIDDITRSREYGAREIRSSFTDEWLSRLGSPKTPELSPVQTSGLGRHFDALEALTPTRRPPRRPHREEGSSSQPGPNSKQQSKHPRSPTPEPENRNRRAAQNQNPSSSDTRHTTKFPKNFTQASQDPPSTDAAVPTAIPQNAPQEKRTKRATDERSVSRAPATSSNRRRAQGGVPSSLQVNPNEDSLPKPSSGSHKELAEDMGVISKNFLTTSVSPDATRNHHSEFTPINRRFSSPPAEPEPFESTTPPGRPVLGDKSVAYNTNPLGVLRSPFPVRNEGVLVMSAGDLRLDDNAAYAMGKDLEGQENNFPSKNDNKGCENSLLKGVLVQSAEKCVASVRTRPKKPRNIHPLQASPITTDSPGFTYRKVSKPIENIPNLRPRNQPGKRTVGQKRRARMMIFGSLPLEPAAAPVPEPSNPANDAADQDVAANALDDEPVAPVEDEQTDKGGQTSPTRDLSTQAAILFAQQEFQQQFGSPLKKKPVLSPETDGSSQQARTSTPAPSEPPPEYAAVTPFKVFNEGKLFLEDNPPQLAPIPMSTQELFNAASPFAFSTVKKNKNKRKRVSLAASPLKLAGDRNTEDCNAEVPAREGGNPSQTAIDGDATLDVTLAGKSTTPPTPKLPSFAQENQQPSSGLKPHSLNPTLSSAMKIKSSRCMTASSRASSQVSSSFPRLGQPLSSSAPQQSTPSHALRQEFRRAQSQSRSQQSQSQNQSQSQSSQQQRSSQQQQQQSQQGWDHVDLDSAMDAADSFLDSANLGLGMGTPGG